MAELRREPAAPEFRDRIEGFSRALVNRLLDEPSRRLRRETDPARSAAFARAARGLFGLDGPGRAAAGS